jgi:hypothetical protein
MDKFAFFEIDAKVKEEFSDFDSLTVIKNYYFIKLLLASNYFGFANRKEEFYLSINTYLISFSH